MLKHKKPTPIIVLVSVLFVTCSTIAQSDSGKRFTVEDDIGIATFRNVAVSPNARMVVIQTERASLKDGKLHDTLRIYDLVTIRQAVNAHDQSQQVKPVWSFERVGKAPEGNVEFLSNLKWLPDSSAVAFLSQEEQYHCRLYLARLASKSIVPLTASRDDVLGFDVRDMSHYVFTVASRETDASLRRVLHASFRVGTGHPLYEVAFPEQASHIIQRGDLWAANGGKPLPVRDRRTGAPIRLYSDGNESLALSPDGGSVITVRAIEDVPEDWEERFPPPFPDSTYRLRAHHQDLAAAADGWSYVGEWVRVVFATGSITSLTNAPASHRAGWWEVLTTRPSWSDDGSNVILPGTFSAAQSGNGTRPCVSVMRIEQRISECVTPLKRQLANGFEQGYEGIDDVRFEQGRNDMVIISHFDHNDRNRDKMTIYVRSASGQWSVAAVKSPPSTGDRVSITVQQSFKEAPLLIATDEASKKTRIILDPNPQLRRIAFGDAAPFNWRDKTGKEWHGLLYKPVGFASGVRYPLVLQTHGYSPDQYLPSGSFPSAFAAQELASAGIMVLQIQDCAARSTPNEAPCNVNGYEGAVEQLSKAGLIDFSRVGIIGFSRTVFYVLQALTNSNIRFMAASITDGMTLGYMNYLTSIGLGSSIVNEQVGIIGSAPFGTGLADWIKSSPDFNLEKVSAPLRIVATRGAGVVEMWEPYAILEAMHKPADFIVLNTGEHILVDPAMRLAAQGGNVDWFRFWLQEYEDPDRSKRNQYERWEKLRDSTLSDQELYRR